MFQTTSHDKLSRYLKLTPSASSFLLLFRVLTSIKRRIQWCNLTLARLPGASENRDRGQVKSFPWLPERASCFARNCLYILVDMFSLFCYFVHTWINMTDINTSCSNYFSLFVANVLFLRRKKEDAYSFCCVVVIPSYRSHFFCATVICGTVWNTSRFLKSFRASEFCSGQPIFMSSLPGKKLSYTTGILKK